MDLNGFLVIGFDALGARFESRWRPGLLGRATCGRAEAEVEEAPRAEIASMSCVLQVFQRRSKKSEEWESEEKGAKRWRAKDGKAGHV